MRTYTADEALKQALEYLRDNQHYIADNERHAYVMEYNAFVEHLEALVEQPAQQQEPVAIDRLYIEALIEGLYQNEDPVSIDAAEEFERLLKTPASPPASKLWVGLTEEERKEIYRQAVYVDGAIRMTEAKLKEKNA